MLRLCLLAFLMLAVATPVSLPLPAFAAAEAQSELDADLLYRVSFGRPEDVKILLERGASPNATNELDYRALTIALERSDIDRLEMVQHLIDAGAELNFQNERNPYPLITAIRQNDPAMVRYMLLHRADFYAQTTDGTTALAVAREYGHPEIIAMVESLIRREEERLAKLRSPENLIKQVQEFGYHTCLLQYYHYTLADFGDRISSEQQQRLVTEAEKAQDNIAKSIQLLNRIFVLPQSDVNQASKLVQDSIYLELEELVSPANRMKHGVGTEGDGEKRCRIVSNRLNMNVEGIVFIDPLLEKKKKKNTEEESDGS